MSDNEHERKRRRLGAAATLSKPFKSPLRAGVASSIPLSPPETIMTPRHAPEPTARTPAPNADQGLFISSPSLPNPPRLVVSTRSQYLDPELLDLQKRYRTLSSQRATKEKTLEAAQQALRIESSSNDADLEALITTWRLISQEAAEEVFGDARERVARMGGMKAWRERSKQYATRWESENQSQDQDQAYMYDEDMDHHPDTPNHLLEENGSAKHDEETPEARNLPFEMLLQLIRFLQEFTMEFMLKTLNIEHKTIGFDAVMGKWIRN